MTSRLGAAEAWDSSSRPLSLLERKSNPIKPALSSSQALVDGAVGSFVDQATDWKSMAAILAGTGAYRLGRMGILGFGEGNALRALSVGAGLAAEVSAFEGVHRSLQNNPNPWRWNGQNGLKQGLISSLITFGTLKGIGGLTQGENLILRHATQDLGMVLGHQLAYQTGAGPKPEGSWAERLVEAEATNLKIGAAMALMGKGPGFRNPIFKEGISSPKHFFPSVLAAEPANSRETALGPRWMLMAAEGEAEAGGPKKIPKAISREAKEEELIRFAYESLEQWKKDPESSFDYGKFFLEVETELGRKPFSETQKKKVFSWWEKKVASNEAAIHAFRNYGRNDVERAIRRYIALAPDMQRQAAALASQHLKTFLFHSDNKANMSDFALCGRGNCSARAKFVLSTGSAAKLPLPKNLKWAVQNYANHLETVLYDETAEQIWVFSSGRLRVVNKIEASLYHPSLFFHAFLKNKGRSSPVDTRDLVMREIPDDPNTKPEPSSGGEEPFIYPSAHNYFRGGETFWGHGIILPGRQFSWDPHWDPRWAPRRGILILLAGAAAASLVLQNRKEETPAPQKNDDPLPKPPERQEVDKNKAFLWKDAQWTRPVTQLELSGGEPPTTQIRYTGFYIMPDGHVLLEKPEDIETFNQLSTPEERYHFLVKVAERKETEEDFQAAFSFLLDPAQAIRNTSPEELKKTAGFLKGIEFAHKRTQSQMERGLAANLRPDFTERLKSSSPYWRAFYQNLEIWKKWTHDHPAEFFTLLNETPLEKKIILVRLRDLDESNRLFYEKGLILSKSKKEETAFDSALGPKTEDVLIEMDLEMEGFEFPPTEKPSHPPPEKTVPPPKEAPPESTITISPETALIYALSAESFKGRTPLLQNWSPELTRTFMDLNRNGEYDNAFLAAANFALNDKTGDGSYSWAKSQLPPSMGPILDDIARRHPKGFDLNRKRMDRLMKDFIDEGTRKPLMPMTPIMKPLK